MYVFTWSQERKWVNVVVHLLVLGPLSGSPPQARGKHKGMYVFARSQECEWLMSS
jgi:hypothetical protein